MTAIGLLGLGEVGRVLAEDLPGDARLTVWDTAFAEPHSAASHNAVELSLPPGASAADAVHGADLVISAVTAAHDLAAVHSVADSLMPGCWFLDLNSASPTQKQAAAAVLEAAGARYVEAAVMSPIEPKRLAAPVLLGGPHATAFEAFGAALGFTGLEVYSDRVGPAAATKLCRSVVIKGLETLLLKSMLTARSWGVEDRVLASLANLVPGPDWPELASYLISRALLHGGRRAEEMREAADTVAAAGVEPWLATATAKREAWAGTFADVAASSKTVAELVDAIRAHVVVPA